MLRNYFQEVWDLHPKLLNGILYNKTEDLGYGNLITSPVPGEYFNYLVPKTTDFMDLDLEDLNGRFKSINQMLCIYLLEEHQKLGFVEYLIRKGLKFEGRDSWMGYDAETYSNSVVKSTVTDVGISEFDDYRMVSEKVFSDFPGNGTYIEICRKSIGGLGGEAFDLKSEFFLIYDSGKPAANGGMFYSKKENFAYLHDAGTLEEFRGKGYQSDLIKFRVNKALSVGIDRIYSSVDHGSKSWSNSIKCGLNNMHTGIMLVRDS